VFVACVNVGISVQCIEQYYLTVIYLSVVFSFLSSVEALVVVVVSFTVMDLRGLIQIINK